MENSIEQNQFIELIDEGDNNFSVVNPDTQQLIELEDDFHLYITHVTFKENGTITGTFKGFNPTLFIDEFCQIAEYNKETKDWKSTTNNKLFTKADLVVIKNKEQVILFM